MPFVPFQYLSIIVLAPCAPQLKFHRDRARTVGPSVLLGTYDAHRPRTVVPRLQLSDAKQDTRAAISSCDGQENVSTTTTAALRQRLVVLSRAFPNTSARTNKRTTRCRRRGRERRPGEFLAEEDEEGRVGGSLGAEERRRATALPRDQHGGDLPRCNTKKKKNRTKHATIRWARRF